MMKNRRALKTILHPLFLLKNQYEERLRRVCPEKLFAYCYWRQTGLRLNINHPKTLYDKIAYLAFRTDTSEWSRLTDKVAVRDYLKECGLDDYLPSLYGVWEHAADICFETLPESLVLKTNNASATNILVKQKSDACISEIRKQLDWWMSYDYGYATCQPHYSRIKPMILAEEYLDVDSERPSLVDYKFYCTSGHPLYVFVYSDREPNTHNAKLSVYDLDWHEHPEFRSKHFPAGQTIEKPRAFEKMCQIASRLSRPFPFVRVDLYDVHGAPVFGEMTFTPGTEVASDKFLIKMGKLVQLP